MRRALRFVLGDAKCDGHRCERRQGYAKRPFGGPEQVLAYLGRYTHRVAIANSRLVEFADCSVRFRWKDYRHHDKQKVMTLEPGEFIRRFLLHVLPDGFHRIRHYGFLANGRRAAKLESCRRLLAVPAPPPVTVTKTPDDYRDRHHRLTGHDLRRCPCCGGTMSPLAPIPRWPVGHGLGPTRVGQGVEMPRSNPTASGLGRNLRWPVAERSGPARRGWPANAAGLGVGLQCRRTRRAAEHINGEIKRRTEVVGIVPNEAGPVSAQSGRSGSQGRATAHGTQEQQRTILPSGGCWWHKRSDAASGRAGAPRPASRPGGRRSMILLSPPKYGISVSNRGCLMSGRGSHQRPKQIGEDQGCRCLHLRWPYEAYALT